MNYSKEVVEVIEFVQDDFFVPESEQGLMIIKGNKDDFTELDGFWNQASLVESWLEFDKESWKLIDQQLLLKEIAAYTSELKHTIALDLDYPICAYKIAHEWDNTAVFVETSTNYFIIHWWTTA